MKYIIPAALKHIPRDNQLHELERLIEQEEALYAEWKSGEIMGKMSQEEYKIANQKMLALRAAYRYLEVLFDTTKAFCEVKRRVADPKVCPHNRKNEQLTLL